MNKPVIVSLQRPQNDNVLMELMGAGRYDIAVLGHPATGALAHTAGKFGTALLEVVPASLDTTAKEAVERSEAIAARLTEVVESRAEIAAFGRDEIVRALTHSLDLRLRASMSLVDALDRLRQGSPDLALIVNETDLEVSRTAALWARHHRFPVFMISSRTNLGEPSTVTRRMLADYFFVFGERSAQPYLDMGIAADRIAVTGNPAWDHYGKVLERRGHYRSEVFANHALRPGAPLVIFATTWNAKLSALFGEEVYEKTARLFLRACKLLAERGLVFNAVIKDLPAKAGYGRPLIAKIGVEEEFDRYVYAAGEMPLYLCAADALVGYDASVFLEAMMAGVPAFNIWTPSSWLLGPAMDERDGVPLVSYDDAAGLAALLHAVLAEPYAKMRHLSAQQKRFAYFHVRADGKSAQRCAYEIMKRLSAAGMQRRTS